LQKPPPPIVPRNVEHARLAEDQFEPCGGVGLLVLLRDDDHGALMAAATAAAKSSDGGPHKHARPRHDDTR
jgi:hypothetical protein